MKSKTHLRMAAFPLLAVLSSSLAQAALVITNGDFESGITDNTTNAVVNGWFSVTTGDFFANTWLDTRDAEVPTDAQSGFSGQAAAAFSGIAGNQPAGLAGSWLYQSIGTDATVSSLSLHFDWGDFGNAPTNRDLGMSVAIYEWDGTGGFVAGNDTDVNGASGVTLLDSVSLTRLSTGSLKLFLDEAVNLDVSGQSGGELFLRFNNYDGGPSGDAPWLMLDNVEIIPEPSAALLGGLGMLALLRRRRA